MLMPVPTISHGSFVTKQMLGAPDHEVSLPDRHLKGATRATIRLLRAALGYLTHEPFGSAPRYSLCAASCETFNVSRRLLSGALVLVYATMTRHG